MNLFIGGLLTGMGSFAAGAGFGFFMTLSYTRGYFRRRRP